MLSTTYVSREAARRLRQGAAWARREDIVSMDGTPTPGEPVQLKDEDGQPLGMADVDLETPYAVRRIGLPDEPLEGLIPRHVRHALTRRARLVDDPRFCRIINDDGDGLPGLTVDRFDTHFVARSFSRSMDARVQDIARALVEVAGASSVLLRNDAKRRKALGLPQQRPHVLHGTPPRWSRVLEMGARFTVDLSYGLGSGFHYDHREVRRFIARVADGARVLDPCCGMGGLFVHAGLHGARFIHAFDANQDAAELARENAEANGLLGRVRVEKGPSLAVLRSINQPFDLVLLDTPDAPGDAEFIEQLRLGLRCTRRGGRIVTIGYSPPLTPGQFETLLASACEQEGRTAYQLARFGLPSDHPTLVGSPSAVYLSGAALELA